MLSGIGKRKREFVCRGTEIKLRLIVMRTCTSGVHIFIVTNLTLPKGRKGVQKAKAPVGDLGGDPRFSSTTFTIRTLEKAILVRPLFTIKNNMLNSFFFVCASYPLASASQTVLRVKFSAHFVSNWTSFGKLTLKNY